MNLEGHSLELKSQPEFWLHILLLSTDFKLIKGFRSQDNG